jgi:hypothetical protein
MKFYKPTLDEILGGRALTMAETRLLACCKTGVAVFCGNAVPDKPSDENEIDAALIRYLLLGGCDAHQPHPSGVKIKGGYISGVLNFEGCETALTLFCSHCRFSDEPNFRDAEIGQLNLYGSHIPCLNGHRMRVKRSVLMSGEFKARGTVNLSSAYIKGTLSCNGGEFDGTGQNALNCAGLRVGASVFLGKGFKAIGQVFLRGATIGGQLSCVGGEFDGVGQNALDCDAMQVGKDVYLRDGFKAKGQVVLRGATIGGQFSCIGGEFDRAGKEALNCDKMQVGASVFLRDGFKAKGEVVLRGATISGQLDCTGGEFDGGLIEKKQRDALNCDAMLVGKGVFLRNGFKAIGRVIFTNANISDSLQCHKLKVNGDFIAKGMIVGREFRWRYVDGEQSEVNLSGAQVGVLVDDVGSWNGVGRLYLKGFKYGAIDNQRADFPLEKRLEWLHKSYCQKYQISDDTSLPTVVMQDSERFEPQPYTQLAQVLQRDGQRGAAEKVREVMERRLRKSEFIRKQLENDGRFGARVRSVVSILTVPFDQFFGRVFGYGHAPMRGLWFAFGVIVASCIFFGAVYEKGQFAPNSDIILTNDDWKKFADDPLVANPAKDWSADDAGKDYESFSAIGYGIDLFLPLDALGQEGAWAPSRDRGNWGFAGFYLRWVVQFLGWVFTAVLAAALTGIIGRKE